jgi:hypothetical protein
VVLYQQALLALGDQGMAGQAAVISSSMVRAPSGVTEGRGRYSPSSRFIGPQPCPRQRLPGTMAAALVRAAFVAAKQQVQQAFAITPTMPSAIAAITSSKKGRSSVLRFVRLLSGGPAPLATSARLVCQAVVLEDRLPITCGQLAVRADRQRIFRQFLVLADLEVSRTHRRPAQGHEYKAAPGRLLTRTVPNDGRLSVVKWFGDHTQQVGAGVDVYHLQLPIYDPRRQQRRDRLAGADSRARHELSQRLVDRARAEADRARLLDEILEVLADPDIPDEQAGQLVRQRLGLPRLLAARRSAADREQRDHGHFDLLAAR